jgi:hypothetical protein
MAHQLGFAVDDVVPVRGHPILARWQTSLFAESLFFVLRPRQNPAPSMAPWRRQWHSAGSCGIVDGAIALRRPGGAVGP